MQGLLFLYQLATFIPVSMSRVLLYLYASPHAPKPVGALISVSKLIYSHLSIYVPIPVCNTGCYYISMQAKMPLPPRVPLYSYAIPDAPIPVCKARCSYTHI